MTEDEAEKHMCPFMVIVGALSLKVAESHGIRCVASECMMWVWDVEYVHPANTDGSPGIGIPNISETKGRCGLIR